MSSDPRPADPLVFAVGCPRSGTTLLQRILDAHPELAVANDSHFVPRCLEKEHKVADALAGRPVPLTDSLLARVRDYRRFPRLGLEAASVERAAARASTYAEFVGALYEEFAARHGKRHGGEKTPDYVRKLPLLHALFPASRFLHIVRDGRDVALSVLQWANERKGPGKLALWRDEPLAVAALWWGWQVESGREAGARLPERSYLEIRYEALVAEQEPTVRRICAFLELPYTERMLAFHEGKTRDDPSLSAKRAWLPATAGLRDWRSQMTDEDIDLFEALVGDLLDQLGLERGGRPPSAEIERRAAICRAFWRAELDRRAAKEGRPRR